MRLWREQHRGVKVGGIASGGSDEINRLEDALLRFCNRQTKEKGSLGNRDAEHFFSSQFVCTTYYDMTNEHSDFYCNPMPLKFGQKYR
jgi:hypothetical protein